MNIILCGVLDIPGIDDEDLLQVHNIVQHVALSEIDHPEGMKVLVQIDPNLNGHETSGITIVEHLVDPLLPGDLATLDLKGLVGLMNSISCFAASMVDPTDSSMILQVNCDVVWSRLDDRTRAGNIAPDADFQQHRS